MRFLACLIYFPTLIFWGSFVITWRLAYKILPYPGSHKWNWLKVKAFNNSVSNITDRVDAMTKSAVEYRKKAAKTGLIYNEYVQGFEDGWKEAMK